MIDAELDPLAMVPRWFKHLSATIGAARVETLRECISGLSSSSLKEVSEGTLVLAAHRVADGGTLKALDAALVESSPTYAADENAEELHTLCAAALVKSMSASGAGATKAGAARAVRISLLVQSAEFAGMKPVLREVTQAADYCLDRASRRARKRLKNDAAARTVSKLTTLPDPAEVTPDPERMYELIVQRDTAIASLASRLEALVNSFNSRLELMDEEIDVLWWARSGRSLTTGKSWSAMSELDRAVASGHEMSQMVRQVPATRGSLAVLQTIASGESAFTIFDVLESIARLVVDSGSGHSDRLSPLASGMIQFSRYGGDEAATVQALKAEGIVPEGHTVTAPQIAAQLLRERAIEVLS